MNKPSSITSPTSSSNSEPGSPASGARCTWRWEGDDFYVDPLFCHLKLRAYFVIETRAGKFKPEHIGQLGFCMTAVDAQVKHADAPTIGLLLCKTKNEIVAEYALRDTARPLGISEYQLAESLPEPLQISLPHRVEQIERELAGGQG